MPTNVLVLAFTTVYFFAFREAVRTATSWGAFQVYNADQIFKKLTLSLSLVLLPPVVFFIPALTVVAALVPNHGQPLTFTLDLLASALMVLLLGPFPRAPKHAWLIVARNNIAKGTGPGEPGEDWFHRSITDPDRDLPHRWYSFQVLALLGAVPLAILSYKLWTSARRLPTGADLITLYTAIYAAQIVVVRYRARDFNFFYRVPNPKWLWTVRMWLTVPATLILPLAFGIGLYPWLVWARDCPNTCCRLLAGQGLIVGLFFPFYCYQAVLLVARRNGWVDDRRNPEVSRGIPWVWISCAALALISILGLISSIIWAWPTYRSVAARMSDAATELLKR